MFDCCLHAALSDDLDAHLNGSFRNDALGVAQSGVSQNSFAFAGLSGVALGGLFLGCFALSGFALDGVLNDVALARLDGVLYLARLTAAGKWMRKSRKSAWIEPFRFRRCSPGLFDF